MNKLNMTVELRADSIDKLIDGLEGLAEILRTLPDHNFSDGTYEYENYDLDYVVRRECDEGLDHNWRYVGTTCDGTRFFRCKTCSINSEP